MNLKEKLTSQEKAVIHEKEDWVIPIDLIDEIEDIHIDRDFELNKKLEKDE